MSDNEADAIVQKCADFAKQVILGDRLPTDEKPRNHKELAALVYNSLVHLKSKPNEAKGETSMVLGTGKERPLPIGCEADGNPEARFESASLHQHLSE